MDSGDQHMGIVSAINLGFRAEAMTTRHKYWDFGATQSEWEWLAGELKPNTFDVAKSILAELEEEGSSLSRSKKALDFFGSVWEYMV